MEMTSENILPCPFCGARVEDYEENKSKGLYVYRGTPAEDVQAWLHVVCLECYGSAPNVRAWNRRAK